jgi:two-component system OmpR family sensor kinase
MFRSLAARLTATYVFAAIVLVVVVVAGVVWFSISQFGIASRSAMDAVAKMAPFEAKIDIARAGSLRAAAPQIVRTLARPGLRVELFGRNGSHGFEVAAEYGPGPDGQPAVSTRQLEGRWPGPPPFGPPSFGPARPGEGFRDGPGYRQAGRFRPYPFGLTGLLHIEPRFVRLPEGTLHIWPDPAPFEGAIGAFLWAMIPLGLGAVIAAWLLGRFITGQALRPLVETTASLNRFGAGDFTARTIMTSDRSEIGELAKAYNAAAAQVTAAFEERRVAEARMRQFIADAGHELRTPLTVIMGFIDVLRRRAQSDATMSSKIYDTMLVESRRMKDLIDKLIVLARLDTVHERELETVDLGDVASQVVAAREALETRPRIALRVEDRAIVRGYESELHDALANLVENALKYAPDSPVEVRVHGEGGAAVVDVIDHGPGIPRDEQESVFSRFYRGRDRGDAEGFGLGLAIARRAVERSGGDLSLASTPGQGSVFTIRLPRAERGEAVAFAV